MSDPHALLDQLKVAYNNHDHEAMAGLYSDSAILVEPGREVIQSRAAIGAHWADMFGAFPDIRMTYTELRNSETAGMAEGTIEGTQTGVYPTPSGSLLPGTGRTVPFHS